MEQRRQSGEVVIVMTKQAGERGFTLIEIVVTIAIIAMLVAAASTIYNGQRLGSARVSLETARARLRYCAQLASMTGDGATCWFHLISPTSNRQQIDVLLCRPKLAAPSVSDVCRRPSIQSQMSDAAIPSVTIDPPAELHAPGDLDPTADRYDFAFFFRPEHGFGFALGWDPTQSFGSEPPRSHYDAQLTLDFGTLAQALTLDRRESLVNNGHSAP